MPRIIASAPVLLVSDVRASAEYFRDNVGFKYDQFYGEPPSFCICTRDGHYLMPAQPPDPSQIKPFCKIRECTWNAYFWDADALCAEMKAAGARWTTARARSRTACGSSASRTSTGTTSASVRWSGLHQRPHRRRSTTSS